MFKKNKRDPRNTALSATPKSTTSQVPRTPISLKSFGAASIADENENLNHEELDVIKQPTIPSFGAKIIE